MPEFVSGILFEVAMVRNIVRGESIFRVAEKATKEDMGIARDLLDTLKANSSVCVGMAANMIGINKRIIAFSAGPFFIAMFNPRIISSKRPYTTEEGCLSLDGKRSCLRFEEIEVEFQDMDFRKQKQKFSGFPAEIIQHEIDHLDGKII